MAKDEPIFANDALRWQAFKTGDKQAFSEIYKIYISDLLSYGYRITSDQQLIKDSVQDLFLHLWQTRNNLADTDSIRFYLYRSLRNRIVRNIEKHQLAQIDTDQLLGTIIGALSIEDEILAQENQNEQILKLKRAIQQLPKRKQEIIQLRYYHDFTLDEIAQIMDINNQSVRNLLHRTLVELRDNFAFFWLVGLLAIAFRQMLKNFL